MTRMLSARRGAIAALALLIAALPAVAQERVEAAVATPAAVVPVGTTDLAFGERSRSFTLADLGIAYPLRLRTVFGQAGVPLQLRADQVVTRARLELRYAHSPSLRFEQSHLSVFVNDQLVRTLPLTAESASGRLVELNIDPRLLLPSNQIRFELVAHYAQPNECEDPGHSTLWLDVSNDSRLLLELSPLSTAPALDRLPAPLFDVGDRRRLRLPFVFSARPSPAQIKAAAIVAGWFGAQADYRGAEFPALFGTLPEGHGVAFVIGNGGIPGLNPGAGGSQQPTISMVGNAAASQGRLLVFSAPDEAGLIAAAQAFALGQIVLQGDRATVGEVTLPDAKGDWKSPRWIDPSRPYRLEQGALGPLSVTGLMPGPVRFEFSLPPDFFPLSADSVNARLRYRAAPVTAANSSLNAEINGQFVGSVKLDTAAAGSSRLTESEAFDIVLPTLALRAHNRLDAQFHFRRDTTKPCEDFDVSSLQGSIDPASEVRISRYAHFVDMPALELLADGGFPFSRRGDLGGTALVLPPAPTESEIAAALTVAGHLGRWTRDAATRLEVVSVAAIDSVADRDLLIVGRAAALPTLSEWSERAPLSFDQNHVTLKPVGRIEALQARIADRDLNRALAYAGRVAVQSGESLGAIMAFESPLSRGRSVVWVTAGSTGDVARVAATLIEPGEAQFVRGGLTLVNGSEVSGYELGARYGVGSLPWWFAIKRWLSQHPYLLVPIMLLIALLAGWALYGLLAARARKRQAGKI